MKEDVIQKVLFNVEFERLSQKAKDLEQECTELR